MSTQSSESTDATHPQTGRWRTRTGIALIILSGVFWFSLFAVPFTPLSTSKKAVLAGILFAAVQVAWWTGAALVGPRAILAIRKRIFRR